MTFHAIAHARTDEQRSKGAKSRAYFFPKGDLATGTDYATRRRRYRAVLPYALAEAFACSLEEGQSLAAGAEWSQKAGCRCGCSPGFVLQLYRGDVFVDIE